MGSGQNWIPYACATLGGQRCISLWWVGASCAYGHELYELIVLSCLVLDCIALVYIMEVPTKNDNPYFSRYPFDRSPFPRSQINTETNN